MTALGAGVVFVSRDFNKKLLDMMLGFAAGVMISASYWSLLAPAIKMSRGGGLPSWLPATAGFIAGAIVLRIIDLVLPHLHAGFSVERAEGAHTSWRRSTLLVLAITMHNIPEGLAIGVAFGAAAADGSAGLLAGAAALAIGIGVQDVPEGLAVSMPLRRDGMSRGRSFWYGQLSGLVEPAAAVLAAAAVGLSRGILPYALGFSAGAMIYVVVEEVIPESQTGGNSDIATIGTIIGFVLMMVLDVALTPS
jgi:ZIP family zinc transporter